MLGGFNRFVEEHTVLFYALVVALLVAAGVLLDGNPFSALGYAVGEALRPVGQTR